MRPLHLRHSNLEEWIAETAVRLFALGISPEYVKSFEAEAREAHAVGLTIAVLHR